MESSSSSLPAYTPSPPKPLPPAYTSSPPKPLPPAYTTLATVGPLRQNSSEVGDEPSEDEPSEDEQRCCLCYHKRAKYDQFSYTSCKTKIIISSILLLIVFVPLIVGFCIYQFKEEEFYSVADLLYGGSAIVVIVSYVIYGVCLFNTGIKFMDKGPYYMVVYFPVSIIVVLIQGIVFTFTNYPPCTRIGCHGAIPQKIGVIFLILGFISGYFTAIGLRIDRSLYRGLSWGIPSSTR